MIGAGNDHQFLPGADFVVKPTTLTDRHDPVAIAGDDQDGAAHVADGLGCGNRSRRSALTGKNG